MLSDDRVVYLNGEFVPESGATVSIRDLGFIHGDAAFDTARTFNGKVFKLRAHLDRLYQSCKFLRIDPVVSKEGMEELTLEVVERNKPLLGPSEDYWVTQRVTRGLVSGKSGPTVLIECRPLPLAQRAHLYRDGVQLATSSMRRSPPWVLSPQAKTHNYLNVVMADMEVKSRDPEAWVVLLDEQGNLTEGAGSNVFIVKDGTIYTSRAQMVLGGITRGTALDLARGLGLPAEERDIDLFDAYAADEMFVTATSMCVCPAASLNGVTIGDGKLPGPVTRRLMAAFSDTVGMDYVAQYMAHL